jgi:hypothetical protein
MVGAVQKQAMHNPRVRTPSSATGYDQRREGIHEGFLESGHGCLLP